MVIGGGILISKNLDVSTKGKSSYSIRNDRSGGTLTIKGGTYGTKGIGSPANYSSVDIIFNKTTLKITSSEILVIESSNSVTLNNIKIVDINTTLNRNNETYKNIFIFANL